MSAARLIASSRKPSPRSRRRSVLLVQSWWEERVLRGVADYAAKNDWELQCRMRWTHELPEPHEWRGDGIIAFAGVSRYMQRIGKPLIDFVRGAGVPVVETQELGNFFNAPKVIVPHAEIGRMGAEYFLALNYRDLGFVTFDENLVEENRRAAFRAAAEAGGATFHALTARTLIKALAHLPRPLALFAVNDANALAVVRLCRDAGRSVPEEVAVMGIDDTEIVCDLAAVPLTSINCNYERQGYQAAALLDRLMNGEEPPSVPVVIHPRGVTVRTSTDTVAIPDIDAARVLRALRDRFREPITVQQIFESLDLPQRRVQDSFRTHVGRTMGEELTRLRIEHAKKLLPDRTLKLEGIAHDCGFASRFHFTAAFKRTTGITPRAFRVDCVAENAKRTDTRAREAIGLRRT